MATASKEVKNNSRLDGVTIYFRQGPISVGCGLALVRRALLSRESLRRWIPQARFSRSRRD